MHCRWPDSGDGVLDMGTAQFQTAVELNCSAVCVTQLLSKAQTSIIAHLLRLRHRRLGPLRRDMPTLRLFPGVIFQNEAHSFVMSPFVGAHREAKSMHRQGSSYWRDSINPNFGLTARTISFAS